MRNISQGALKSIRLPLHHPDEQAVALATYRSVLESIRTARQALETQARKSSALRRAILNSAFSGRLTGAESDLDLIEELSGT